MFARNKTTYSAQFLQTPDTYYQRLQMDTSLEWASYVIELSMEEDWQVASWTANTPENDNLNSYAVLQNIQKETPNLSSSLHCLLKFPTQYLQHHKLKGMKAHLPSSFVYISMMIELSLLASIYPVPALHNTPSSF